MHRSPGFQGPSGYVEVAQLLEAASAPEEDALGICSGASKGWACSSTGIRGSSISPMSARYLPGTELVKTINPEIVNSSVDSGRTEGQRA